MNNARPLFMVIALTAVAVSGCGSSHQAIPTPVSTTTSQPANAQAVLSDYRAFWDDYVAVTNPMVPGNPRIAAHSTEDELTALNATVLAGQQGNDVFRGTVALAPHVESVAGDTALVDDCTVDHTGQYSVSNGTRLDKEDLTPQNLLVTLKNVGGDWKVSTIDHRSAPCSP